MKILPIIFIVLCLTSCETYVENRGYIFDNEIQQKIVLGMDKSEIISIMGSPSTKSNENGDRFYYISNKFLRNGFLAPKEIRRTVYVISFDDYEQVINTEEYALKDGKFVNYNSDKTIPKGTELTVIQDLFDNVGRYTDSKSMAESVF